jgi:ferritin-like metal-binding protein YciE
MKLETLKQLYVSELVDLYDAETQIVKALPKMAEASTLPELRQAFEKHLEVTKLQVQRLDRIFQTFDERPRIKSCKGMSGLIDEGNERVRASGEAAVIDAALIAAAQRVEHYEIAAYGCARTYAELLGDDQAAELLQQSLDEEAQTDEELTDLATSVINLEAAEA